LWRLNGQAPRVVSAGGAEAAVEPQGLCTATSAGAQPRLLAAQ
jgi:hypothetical protein